MNFSHFTICFSLILIASLFAGCTGPATDNNKDTANPSRLDATDTSFIEAPTLTKEEACSIALTHAGFSKDQIRLLQAEYDWDNGIPHYDVEFYQDRFQYDYEIHAETGEILKNEKEWDD